MKESNLDISKSSRNHNDKKKLAKGLKLCDEKECKEESEENNLQQNQCDQT